MPRQLPWKINGTAKSTAARPAGTASCASSPAPRSPAPSSSHRSTAHSTPKSRSTNLLSEGSSSKEKHSIGLDPGRSPSTSPPPEPLKEEPMIEGVRHDDRYRMVEDEFLAVAGDFTRHLHVVEYQRLKNLAKTQNAQTIQNISRPVTGEMTDLVRRRHMALGTAAKQRKGIAKVLGKRRVDRDASTSESENEAKSSDRWTGTSLRGLMDRPRKRAVPLAVGSRLPPLDASPSRRTGQPRGFESRIKAGGSSTAGSSRRIVKRDPSPSSNDDGDLDGHVDWIPKFKSRQPLQKPKVQPPPPTSTVRLASGIKSKSVPASNSLSSSTNKVRSDRPAHESRKDAQAAPHNDVQDDNDDNDDEDFFSRIRSRRAGQRKRSEPQSTPSEVRVKSETQSTSLNEIPFM
ncbi:hypothetical protein B0T17DRAFT_509082 [Bombardia bombarda]|uniref:Uncharacterized protein n=1 Tax=Bombardia bombarda TaxID=252184 RepID=A0AA39WUM4_9PEZI|nr:hypothetical protein B0T17DRAFT_509082 [Bombardia bombarda]